METLENRKKDHITLAFKSQTGKTELDERFHYEPMLAAHPQENLRPLPFLGKEFRVPIWVSSMTGGTKLAGLINRNLARACKDFGMGMGLGSCRILLEDDTYFNDFNMRPVIGQEQALWANLGIAQIEDMMDTGKTGLAIEMIKKLEADGLIIHVNPLQEWFQPEGDRLKYPPLETIKRFIDLFPFPIIVKEVGQGIGPESLRELLQLPLQAIEFAAFGGTNFAKVELMRDENNGSSLLEPLTNVGEDALTMLNNVNKIVKDEEPVCKELIISGGVKNYLDGYYLTEKSALPAIYGMASTFLQHARGKYDELAAFVEGQVKGLQMAKTYLRVKNEY